MSDWEVVIGLEIHAQLATQSKIFSGSATAYGAPPNTQADLVDLAYPGVLPVLNAQRRADGGEVRARRSAPRWRAAPCSRARIISIRICRRAIKSASTSCRWSRAARSQVMLDDGAVKTIGITRAHLEEDAGKSLHEGLANASGIDLNRAGTPLLEIVSEPDMRSAKEAVAYMKKIHTLVRYLEICDGNMQEGSFRCDANVSVRPRGREKFGTRAEIKNLNSFRFVEKAIQYEVARQIELIESGGTVVQETRLYDSDKDETRSMRSKEEANDYRYFPDPDLLPVEIDERIHRGGARDAAGAAGREGGAIRATTSACRPTTPASLSASRELGAYFEAVVARRWARATRSWRRIGSWANCRARSIATVSTSSAPRVDPQQLTGLLTRIVDQDDLRQDRQGSVRGDVVRGQAGGCHHRGEGLAADHRLRAPSRA